MPVHDWKRVPAGIFHNFHHGWLWSIYTVLYEILPSDYYALAEQTTTGRFGPDVLTLSSVERRERLGNGTIATKPKPKASIVAFSDDEYYRRKKKNIAIKHVSDDRVVAVIEIVSPGNKTSEQNFEKFVTKATKLLDQGIHLLIVDVLPPTKRDPKGIHAAIWEEITGDSVATPARKKLTAVSYERAEFIAAYVEPFSVGDKLPKIPVFLDHGDFVKLDLEKTYQVTFAATPKRWQDELVP